MQTQNAELQAQAQNGLEATQKKFEGIERFFPVEREIVEAHQKEVTLRDARIKKYEEKLGIVR
ncbi:hypothetical protein WDW86_21500 [Bdellovibrionota bacterium FG-2]